MFKSQESAKEAKQKTDTRLEVNSSHGFLNVEQLKVIINSLGNKFIIGSDAHVPHNVGNFELAIDTIKEASIDTKTYSKI